MPNNNGYVSAFLTAFSLPSDGGLTACRVFLGNNGVNLPSPPAGAGDDWLAGQLAPPVGPSWDARVRRNMPPAPPPPLTDDQRRQAAAVAMADVLRPWPAGDRQSILNAAAALL